MTPTLLALAILAQPECRSGPLTASLLARESTRIEARLKLPRGLLAAAVLAESGVSARVRVDRRGCDVAWAQVRCSPCRPSCVARLLPMRANLTASARKLARSRVVCTVRPWTKGCLVCKWGMYNPGSVSWCIKVLTIRRRLLRHVRNHANAS